MAKKPLVLIVMGSDSDLPALKDTAAILHEFEVGFRICALSSAHRSPKATRELVKEAEKQGIEVIIAAAGGAAHLAGVIAAETILPVIGVPMLTQVMGGMDSLLSMVQMPSGVPVGVMSVGKSGAVNAAIMAVQILSKKDASLKPKLEKHKAKLAKKTVERCQELEKSGLEEYLNKNFKPKQK